MAKPPSEQKRGASEKDSVSVSFKVDDTPQPVTFSNFVTAYRVGLEVQLDFYQVDLRHLVQAIQAGQHGEKPGEIPALVGSRVVLSVNAFMRAWPVLSEVHAQLKSELEKE